MAIAASVFVALAALLHVFIFTMESITWTTPSTWRRFGIADQQTADTTRPMAYNQGFYNLFLALGAGSGLVLYWLEATQAGAALMLFTMACMVLAALVLTTTGKGYLRPAIVQGTLPLIAIVLLVVSISV